MNLFNTLPHPIHGMPSSILCAFLLHEDELQNNNIEDWKSIFSAITELKSDDWESAKIAITGLIADFNPQVAKKFGVFSSFVSDVLPDCLSKNDVQISQFVGASMSAEEHYKTIVAASCSAALSSELNDLSFLNLAHPFPDAYYAFSCQILSLTSEHNARWQKNHLDHTTDGPAILPTPSMPRL